jgi:hypothetical protein
MKGLKRLQLRSYAREAREPADPSTLQNPG